MEFFRQEYWCGLPFPSPRIFLTEESNLGLLRYRQILYIVPDVVHVLKDGKIVKTAGRELVAEIEEKGYDNL